MELLLLWWPWQVDEWTACSLQPSAVQFRKLSPISGNLLIAPKVASDHPAACILTLSHVLPISPLQIANVKTSVVILSPSPHERDQDQVFPGTSTNYQVIPAIQAVYWGYWCSRGIYPEMVSKEPSLSLLHPCVGRRVRSIYCFPFHFLALFPRWLPRDPTL